MKWYGVICEGVLIAVEKHFGTDVPTIDDFNVTTFEGLTYEIIEVEVLPKKEV